MSKECTMMLVQIQVIRPFLRWLMLPRRRSRLDFSQCCFCNAHRYIYFCWCSGLVESPYWAYSLLFLVENWRIGIRQPFGSYTRCLHVILQIIHFHKLQVGMVFEDGCFIWKVTGHGDSWALGGRSIELIGMLIMLGFSAMHAFWCVVLAFGTAGSNWRFFTILL